MTGLLLAIGEQEGIWSVDNKLSDLAVGYSWMFYKEQDGSTTHWHNGGTYSSSFAAFNRDKGKGLVVLSNRGSDVWSQFPFIGKHKLSVDKLARMLLDGFYRMSD
jgi:hypothetical protein